AGRMAQAEEFEGRWSLVFFGFTSCPQVCPRTLSVLAAVARDPESGVGAGAMQIVFVSVDPERDTPRRVRNYLDGFDLRIIGLTGAQNAVERFEREVGAGHSRVGSGIDHSTSLFLLDPYGR